MKVFCYHETIPGWRHEAGLIELWRESWRRHGWDPHVLSAPDGERHRYFEELSNSPHLAKSVNDWKYTRCCYRRWCAYACRSEEIVVAVDYDVMNYGFTPDQIQLPTQSWQLTVLDISGVPCAMFGRPHAYEQQARMFRNASVFQAAGPLCVGDDLSDMNLLRDFGQSTTTRLDVVRLYPQPGWEQAVLVHFSNDATMDPRASTVRKARNPLS